MDKQDVVEQCRVAMQQVSEAFRAAYPDLSDNERTTYRQRVTEARDTYAQVFADALYALTPEVVTLTQRLVSTNASVQQRLSSMQNVVGALVMATEAVKLATAIASLVSPAGAVTAAAGAAVGAVRGLKRSPPKRRGTAGAGGRDAGGPLNALLIHGIGGWDAKPGWWNTWIDAIEPGFRSFDPSAVIRFDHLEYDDLFKAQPLTGMDYVRAFFELTGESVRVGLKDLFGRRDAGVRGDLGGGLRWYLGMVVQWARSEKLRERLQERLVHKLTRMHAETGRPVDMIFAHSLGSLIAYDTLIDPHHAGHVNGKYVITFGSQIGQPGVRRIFGGELNPLPVGAGQWFHLFNPNDHVFTTELRIGGPDFRQVMAEFDAPGLLNHDAGLYLSNDRTISEVYQSIARDRAGRSLGAGKGSTGRGKAAKALQPPTGGKRGQAGPRNRALIIGIDAYPAGIDPLAGCVNDAYLYSALLQERGLTADHIRLLINERATTDAIRERLRWLLNDVRPDDVRILCFSGHGAQIPSYGRNEEVDHFDECLCPVDFDFSPEHSILDNEFQRLYVDLPRDAAFYTIFDCCHSGGMHRAGGRAIRGLGVPDDIRHRALRWSAVAGQERQWRPRPLKRINPDSKGWDVDGSFFGKDGTTLRLGRAGVLRTFSDERYDAIRKRFAGAGKPKSKPAATQRGPYLPVISEACKEHQTAQEYRDGSRSYGAFTYQLVHMLRETAWADAPLEKLITEVGKRLHQIDYCQDPQLLAPDARVGKPFPRWS